MSELLSQFLPGVRTMRTPAVVALLWILAGLLSVGGWSPKFRADVDRFMHVIAAGISALPKDYLTPIMIIMVYIAGILLTLLSRSLTEFIRGLLLVLLIMAPIWVPVLVLAYFVNLAIRLPWLLPPLIAAGAAILIIASSPSLQSRLGDPLAHLRKFLAIPSAAQIILRGWGLARIGNAMRTTFSNRRKSIRFLCSSEIARQLNDRPALAVEMLQEISPNLLRSIASQYEIEEDEESLRGPGNREGKRLHDEDEASGTLRANLIENASDPNLRSSLAQEAYVGHIWDELSHVLDELEVRLRADHPEIYGDIDRLMSEADFRRSIAWPIGAIFYILANGVLQALTSSWEWAPPLAAASSFLMLAFSAWSLENEHHRVLWASYRQGLVPGVKSRDLQGWELVDPKPSMISPHLQLEIGQRHPADKVAQDDPHR